MNKLRLLVTVFILATTLQAESSRAMTISAASELEASLSGRSGNNFIAPALLEISANGHNLPLEQQEELAKLGFDFSDQTVSWSRPVLPHYYDSGNYRIHYTLDGTDAISNSDTGGIAGIPDYVETVAAAFSETDRVLIQELGFTLPPSDNGKGGSDQFDIYLKSLASNIYAYTYTEDYIRDNPNSTVVEKNAYTSYIEMRNSYTHFPTSEIESIQVTAAHEYFHSIQFGYDALDARYATPNEVWMLEATAVLIEEAVFDDVNDCYQYMPSWFSKPYQSLNLATAHAYGSYIFFQYIEEHLGGLPAIRRIFDESIRFNSSSGDYSYSEIDAALAPVGGSFADALNGMVVSNLIMSNLPGAEPYTYEEASQYPVDKPDIEETINYFAGDTMSVLNYRLDRFASQYFSISTFSPVLVTLSSLNGSDDDLEMLAILEKQDGSYQVETGQLINISHNYNSIYLAVVSHDTAQSNFDFKLFLQEGDSSDFEIPDDFSLAAIYPNPYNSSAGEMVNFTILNRHSQRMQVEIFDLKGRKVRKLEDGLVKFGKTLIPWNGRAANGLPAPSGIYIISVTGQYNQAGQIFTITK